MEPVPEPWEALDIIEEDSLLLHPKRKISLSPNNLPFNPTTPTLAPCSLRSHSRYIPTRLIPGPAAAVQSAKHRKTAMSAASEDPISTQEYIRRSLEDPCREHEDFSRDPWLSAVDFVRRQGCGGMTVGTPLSDIKTGMRAYKVSLIVAIIKSCKPNGLGDMMVTLKDPTGVIDASVHRKVLSEGQFSNDISVGAVLILQKVAVFSPYPSARYLNITLGNIFKVFPKDSGGPLQQNNPTIVVEHASPSVGESREKTHMLSKPHSFSTGGTEDILNSLRQSLIAKGNLHNDKQIDKGSLSAQVSLSGAEASRDRDSLMEKRPFAMKQKAADVMEEVAADNVNGSVLLGDLSSSSSQVHHDHSVTAIRDVDAPNSKENGRSNEVKEQKQTLKTSIPQWTDEQLDELLAFD